MKKSFKFETDACHLRPQADKKQSAILKRTFQNNNSGKGGEIVIHTRRIDYALWTLFWPTLDTIYRHRHIHKRTHTHARKYTQTHTETHTHTHRDTHTHTDTHTNTHIHTHTPAWPTLWRVLSWPGQRSNRFPPSAHDHGCHQSQDTFA